MADYLTTLRGGLMAGTVGEIFGHSLAIRSSASAQVVSADLVSSWLNTWSTGASQLDLLFSPQVVYLEATCAAILDPVLPIVRVAAAFHTSFPAGTVGKNLTGSLPTQNAIAVSLLAGVRDNGAPLKGRFYLPPVCNDAVDIASGLLTVPAQTKIRDAMASWMNALQSQGHTPAVWSRVLGTVQDVLTIRVGDHVDTIRTRRNHGSETYMDSPV